jgi:zona occludens toxin
MDDFVAAALAGRVVVTNVRGLDNRQLVVDTLENAKKYFIYPAFKEIPSSFDIIFVDTTNQAGRDSLAAFFHWVPHGAFLLIDEAQMIFPLVWKEKDLKRFDYPGGLKAAHADNRPPNFLLAFEMHRHYGWDIVLTTPNIKSIRTDIRSTCEAAYKHKNQALIGLGGRYLEAFHFAQDNGTTSQFLSVRNRKIKSYVWKLYKSTATGSFSDTIGGTPLWKNPRVAGLLLLIAGLSVYILFKPAPSFISSPAPVSNLPDELLPVQENNDKTRVYGIGDVVPVKASSSAPVIEHPFSKHQWRLVGVTNFNHQIRFYIELSTETEYVTYSSSELKSFGYSYAYHGQCHIDVTFQNQTFAVRCFKSRHSEPSAVQKSGILALN